jgi:DNA-binding NarL/FixJ family response regulator
VKTLGDGLMACFEAARDAVDCAIGMQIDSTGKGPSDAPLSIRVGVSSGDVAESDGDLHGIAVVQASRLCSRAEPGQVLASEATRLLAGELPGARSVGALELKGLDAPVAAWEIPWSADAAKVRAVLADDAVLVREGIAHVLEAAGVEVVGQAGDGDELVRLAAELRPDVAIVDVRMPPTHTTEGLDAAERMRAENPRLGLMVLSQEVDPVLAGRLLAISDSGVGYLLKERVANLREFAEAVRRVASGGTAFEASVLSSLDSDAASLSVDAVS